MTATGSQSGTGRVIRLGLSGATGADGAGWPAAAQVEGYWHALRGARAMPDRAEIDPRGIEAALPATFLLEPVAPGIARFRVAGQALTELLGMEPRGMPLSAVFGAEARGALGEVLAAVGAGRATASLGLSGLRGLGRPALAARLWLGPLRCRRGETIRILGCLDTRGAVGAAPRRFLIEQVTLAPLSAPSFQGPDPAPHRLPAPGPRPRPQAHGRPALRLVTSGD